MTSNVQVPPETRRPARPQPRRTATGSLVDTLERGGLPLLLVVLILWFSLSSVSRASFTSTANIDQLLANQAVTGIIALAMVLPLSAGYFDLSVAAVAALAGVTAADVFARNGTIAEAVLVALLVAAVAGVVNGLLICRLKLNGLITTLGTYTLIGGILQWYTKGQTISENIPASFVTWSQANWFGVPRPFWLLVGVALVLWYVMTQLPYGRKLESIGSNDRAARLVGIGVSRTVFLAHVGSALLAGVAGILLTSSAGGADPTAGPAYLFPALTAVFLGATCINPGHYNVWGTVLGVLLAAVAVNGFTLLGADTWVTPVFNGAALVAAVAVSTVIGHRRAASAARSSSETSSATPSGEN